MTGFTDSFGPSSNPLFTLAECQSLCGIIPQSGKEIRCSRCIANTIDPSCSIKNIPQVYHPRTGVSETPGGMAAPLLVAIPGCLSSLPGGSTRKSKGTYSHAKSKRDSRKRKRATRTLRILRVAERVCYAVRIFIPILKWLVSAVYVQKTEETTGNVTRTMINLKVVRFPSRASMQNTRQDWTMATIAHTRPTLR